MADLNTMRERLRCNVERIDEIFPGCLAEAESVMSPSGVESYLDAATAVCQLGRGQELVLLFLEGMPEVARHAGEGAIDGALTTARLLSRSTNAKAINPFLASLPAVARRLRAPDLLDQWFGAVAQVGQQAQEGLVPMLQQAEHLLNDLTIGALESWIEQGIKAYSTQPWRYGEWFSIQSADSRAALQRLRNGTLFVDHEQRLAQYLHGFWGLEEECNPFSSAFDILRRQRPHLDKQGFHIPDVLHAQHGVRGIDRYRAMLAHQAAHRLWTQPFIADNYNRFQQVFMETFEDSRVEWLAMQRYPGLRRLFLALHPTPTEGDCPPGWCCINHKAAMLSRAILDPNHPYTDPKLLDFVARFHARMAADPYDTKVAPELGVQYLVAVHEVDFRSPKVFFEDTEVGYRDDNRFLWIFLEDSEEDDDFRSDHNVMNPRQAEDEPARFVRHQREWDREQQMYRHDWVTVYEAIQREGDPALVDKLMEKHRALAKQLRRIVDLLKPQQQVRIRYQEEGDELDLDIAIRALIDHRAGVTPDPRIHFSHRTDGRDIAVLLLLDLSQSINEVPPGGEQSILQLSQEAVSLLAGAIDDLGDDFAIAGFASNTRHEVHYRHFKGFSEAWGPEPKARIAAMEGGLSTRMGAALRTAGHYLSRRANERKLLLILTDGEPHDVDVDDPAYLRADTKKAVEELANAGVTSYCITLDPKADEYVSEIFGRGRYTVVDRIARLPERLPQLFMSLTC